MYLIKKYWLEISEALFISIIAGYIIFIHYENKSLVKDKQVLQSELNASRAYINAQNAIILQNKSDYDEAIKKLPTTLKTIDTRYQTVYTTIEKWRDKNVSTDCNDSLDYLNRFQF